MGQVFAGRQPAQRSTQSHFARLDSELAQGQQAQGLHNP